MTKSAILFGSIGVLTETSDLQRQSYNTAMKEAGLNWNWDRDTYSALLEQAGGKERLALLAAATGAQLDEATIEKIHARKTELACEAMQTQGVTLRSGVAQLVAFAKERDMKIGLVTTTYQPNIDAAFDVASKAGEHAFSRDDFDYIVARDDVEQGKPSPEPYEMALKDLGLEASAALAIEDTATSVMSAKRAGITVIATPGEMTGGQDFWQADLVLNALADGDSLHTELTGLLS